MHQDWEVPIPGFFIIAAKREEVRTIADLIVEEAREFIALAQRVRMGMSEVLSITDVYLFQNEDTRNGFHLWMFPRYEWMEQFGRKIESVRPIMNYAKENLADEQSRQAVLDAADKIRKYLSA